MSVTLQIRRQTTDASLPAANELLEGELLYIEQNEELYIGASNTDNDVVPLTIRPSFLTFKEGVVSDKIVLTAAGGGSYTINSDNLQNNNVFTYTLPSGLPSEKKLLQSDANGNFSYGDVSLSNLENIGNVDPKMTADVLDEDQMLQYDSNTSKWVGKDIVNDLLSSLLLDAESDQTFENLSLLGNLTVKGGSVQLNSINLAVRDKLIGIGIGVGGASEIGTATMDTGVVSIETSSSFSSGDSVFVGDAPNIPTGFYTFAPGVELLLNGLNSDSSGSGNTINLSNEDTVTITNSGKWGDGYSFDGSSSLSVSGDFNFGTDEWTAEFWMYPTAKMGNGESDFMGIYSNNNANWNGNAKIVCYHGNILVSADTYANRLQTSNVYAEDEWHFVRVVRSSTHIKIYVNGSEDASVADTTTSFDFGTTLVVGSYLDGTYRFYGVLDDLRLSKAVKSNTVPTSALSTGYTFTVPNSTATESTPFDVSIALPSTDAQVDGSGLFFPGDTEKSLIWKDGVETKTLNASPSDDTQITPAQAQLEGWFLDNTFENGVYTTLSESVIADDTPIYRPTDHFELKGGDLKVSGDKILFNESEEIVDNTTKKIKKLKVTTSQLTGVFDGGTYT